MSINGFEKEPYINETVEGFEIKNELEPNIWEKQGFSFDTVPDKCTHLENFYASLKNSFKTIEEETGASEMPLGAYAGLVKVLKAEDWWRSHAMGISKESEKGMDSDDNKVIKTNSWDLFVEFVEAEAHTDLSILKFKEALNKEGPFTEEVNKKILSDFVFLRQLFHEAVKCPIKNKTNKK